VLLNTASSVQRSNVYIRLIVAMLCSQFGRSAIPVQSTKWCPMSTRTLASGDENVYKDYVAAATLPLFQREERRHLRRVIGRSATRPTTYVTVRAAVRRRRTLCYCCCCCCCYCCSCWNTIIQCSDCNIISSIMSATTAALLT